MPSVAPTPVVPPVPTRSDTGAEALVRAALATLAKLTTTSGTPIAATVAGPLPNGLTQLIAGTRSLALQLSPPLAPGVTVSISLQSAPDGPKIVVRPTSGPQQGQARPIVPTPPPPSPPTLPQNAAATIAPVAKAPSAPQLPLAQATPVAATGAAVVATRPGSTPTGPTSTAPSVPSPASAPPAPVVATAVVRTSPQPVADDAIPAPPLTAELAPEGELPVRMRSAADAYAGSKSEPAPVLHRSSQSAPAGGGATASLGPGEHQIVDPHQAMARQQSAAPLLARLAAIIGRPDTPPQLREAAVRVLASRVGLDDGAPDGRVLQAAMEGSGTLATPASNQSRAALFVLRAVLLRLAGVPSATASVAGRTAPAPPLAGDPPQRGEAVANAPLDGDRLDMARQLLGHTEGALSRLKLLQLASQPADQRPQTPAAAAEYRVEIPMLLRGETAMVQFVVEREARQKEKARERGWRMRFALSFSATGEIGADVGLYGRTVNVALWADDPATSEAMAAGAAELAPALARHGISLGAVRVRHGRPTSPGRASGAILDSTG